ncbi:hypothetical protein H310_04539 [Aphanomyces invadans]|uniref:Ion transport domain-containing protein n=1 Tax=Aphanomyces invadans TaxID=157072 RepID=A0A024UD51_9STRA|nr:hypothetical protein H310_04539 [Aphanomyces invadans]ETW04194.1 hypothetical protein H310_04539 [Aphanomyces invadans]|eukprot:XP_008867150.1 hypothetical protein H310_04539 [Aphanomyces invadans]
MATKKSLSTRDSMLESVTVIVADDVDDLVEDDDIDDEEDAQKTIVELLGQRKFAMVKKRLLTHNFTDEDLMTLDEDHDSLLDNAVLHNSYEILSLLLEHSNYKLIPKYAGKPLNLAAQRGANNMFQLLVKTLGKDADFTYPGPEDGDGDVALHHAIRNSSIEIAETLIKAGAAVDVENFAGETPLFMAVQTWQTRGIELLLLANASVHHKSHNGRTPLHAAAASGYNDGVKLLLMAGAEIDVKDDDGKYPVQDTYDDSVRATLRTERMTRVKNPAHIMARNGDEDSLNRWLSETIAKGSGVPHVWKGQYLRDGAWSDLVVKVKLVRTNNSQSYKCVGQYQDNDGTFFITGKWEYGRIDVKKTYADDGYTIEYGGDLDESTGELTGEWKAGDLEGELKLNIPLFNCVVCDNAKVPNEQEKCFGCENPESQYFCVDLNNGEELQSLWITLTPDVEANVYRVGGSGYDNEEYYLSGVWKDDELKFSKHSRKSSSNFHLNYNHDTNKLDGSMVDGAGATNSAKIDFELSTCTDCDAKVPLANSKCFNCAKPSLYNWKGQSRVVFMKGDDQSQVEDNDELEHAKDDNDADDVEEHEWRDIGFHMVLERGAAQNCFRLVGEGKDEGELFDAVGTWEGNTIQLTKIYSDGVTEYEGTFDADTNEWTGTCTLSNGNKEEFRVTIPMFSCFLCESPVPTVNDLCLNCNIAVPQWTPQNGKMVNAWVGRSLEGRGEWKDEEFCVKVLRDPAMEAYRFTGFEKNGEGFFAMTGTWKDEEIHMERVYEKTIVKMDGKYDAAKAEWIGTAVSTDSDGDTSNSRFVYKIPLWTCLKCSKAVPIENSVCFTCDRSRRMNTHGRTALMHAADFGRSSILEQILLYMNFADFCTNDYEGKTALDIALSRKLTCANNSYHRTNDETLTCVELLRRRSCLQIKPTAIPDTFAWDKLCCGDCEQSGGNSKEKEVSLFALAKSKNWDELEAQLQSPLEGVILNAQDPDSGSTVTHIVCQEGKHKILKLLLDQSALDLDIFNNEYYYPLYEAMKKDRVSCVQLLLHHGVPPTALEAYETDEYQLTLLNPKARCYKYIHDRITLMGREDLKDYYRANVPSVRVAEKHRQDKQTALHAAIIHSQLPPTIELLAQDDLIDVDAKDKNGNTAMMIAARGEFEDALEYIKILISHEASIDEANMHGKTALMIASVAGHVDIVEFLLQSMADIDIQDLDGRTCLDLVNKCDLGTSSKTKVVTSHSKIKDLLTKEVQVRENSVEFRDKLAKSLMGMSSEEAFLQGGFRKAVNCNPSLARTFLDDSVVISRHDVEFSQLEEIYGEDNETSTLNALLNLKSDDPDYILEARQQCLEHIVIRRMLQIKWELFGLRKYIEQLMMNFLLLVTSTVSSVVFKDKMDIQKGPVIIGVTAVVLTIVTFIFVQLLRPRSFWCLARYFHDGSFRFEPSMEIPELSEKKRRARTLLFQVVLLLTAALVVPILLLMSLFGVDKYFATFNNFVLWLTVSFFLITELQELRAGVLKYFESNINKAQMTIYIVIFFVFVPMKLEFFYVDKTVQIGIGSFITIMLWVLTVQFLEVVPSASYLLPMMSRLLTDVWNFFILFGVFQMGLTITFYQLFKHQNDEAFGTITQSFITTYFVTFGELPLDSLKSFGGDDDFLSTCAVVLIMFHAAVVVILLLNVLLAMMNKTVDSGFEKAKTEALASYAQCILRLEESMNLNKDETIELIHFKSGDGELVLNPIFHEHLAKSDIQIPDEQEAGIEAYQKTKIAWLDTMNSLKSSTFASFESLRKGLNHVQHFVTFDVPATLEVEFALIQKVQTQLDEYIEYAKKTRGQDVDNSLKKLDALVKKTLSTFEDNMLRVWNDKKQSQAHKQCTLLHQMTYKKSIGEILKTLRTEIQSNIEKEIADAKARAAPEPKLSQIVERFDAVDATLKEHKEEKENVDTNEADKAQGLVKKLDEVTHQNEVLASKLDEVTQHHEEMSTQVEAMSEKLEALMAAILELKH